MKSPQEERNFSFPNDSTRKDRKFQNSARAILSRRHCTQNHCYGTPKAANLRQASSIGVFMPNRMHHVGQTASVRICSLALVLTEVDMISLHHSISSPILIHYCKQNPSKIGESADLDDKRPDGANVRSGPRGLCCCTRYIMNTAGTAKQRRESVYICSSAGEFFITN